MLARFLTEQNSVCTLILHFVMALGNMCYMYETSVL